MKLYSLLAMTLLLTLSCMHALQAQEIAADSLYYQTHEVRVRIGRVCYAQMTQNAPLPGNIAENLDAEKDFSLNGTVPYAKIDKPATVMVSVLMQKGRTATPYDVQLRDGTHHYRCVSISRNHEEDVRSFPLKAANERQVFTFVFLVPASDLAIVPFDFVWLLDAANEEVTRLPVFNYKKSGKELSLTQIWNERDQIYQNVLPVETSTAASSNDPQPKEAPAPVAEKSDNAAAVPVVNIGLCLPFKQTEGNALNNAAAVRVGQTFASYEPGLCGAAMKLDGAYATIQSKFVHYGAEGRGEPFAISLWVKPIANRGKHYVYAHGKRTAQNRIDLYADNARWTAECLFNGEKVTLSGALVLNQWQLLTLNVTDDKVALFVNDKSVADVAKKAHLGKINGDVVLGRDSATDKQTAFRGAMDELRLYDSALTPEMIAERVKNKE